MIELKDDQLMYRFPQVHKEAHGCIEFQRTLRIPDDNREYPLPPGLGRFPLHHVDDYAAQVPASWRPRGGVFLPMYQTEAMWINFHADYPCAIKIAAGRINALTGDAWSNELHDRPQDYLVVPGQPWLDGFCVAKGLIRQFVAMPLGDGYTAEEQLTGEAEHGGVQIVIYPMKAEVYEKLHREHAFAQVSMTLGEAGVCEDFEMGLAPGGLMRQEVYEDPHGIDAWVSDARARCYVHIANSLEYCAIAGRRPAQKPPSAKDYQRAGLPWFDYYDAELKALKGADKLAGLDSVAASRIKKGEGVLVDNEAVATPHVVKLGPTADAVREGEF